MEEVNTTSSNTGVTVVGSDAFSNYHVASRSSENPTNVGPLGAFTLMEGTPMKKKRGRPRKHPLDGSTLSPEPISSLKPAPVIDFSTEKRGKVKPPGSVAKQYQPRVETESLFPTGDWGSCSVGGSFTPHIITVNAGEDVTMKVISFSQQGPRAICILSANGVISSVTLRQPDSSGGTLTYEDVCRASFNAKLQIIDLLNHNKGRFEILSLSGSFMPSETGGIRNRSGGMSVSLASPDGRVVGGGVAGLLVAASPVQIVVGSFFAGNQHDQNTKKVKSDPIIFSQAPVMPVSSPDMGEQYRHSTTWPSVNPDSTSNKPTDMNVNLHGQQDDTEYYD